MWKTFLITCFFILVAGGLWLWILDMWKRARLRRATGLVPGDVLRWVNEAIEGGGITWIRILCEESDRFVVAAIKPLPPMVRGTPPHEFLAVYKADGHIDLVKKGRYGIGIK